MKIITLLENETLDHKLKSAHGLSLYIETKKHKILFDSGPNNYFLKNAKKLGVDLKEVDVMILSHGHYDHGGGLKSFIKTNKKAKLYMSGHAFDKHVQKIGSFFTNIGVKQPKDVSRIKFVDKDQVIDDELLVYADVPFQELVIKDPTLMYENEEHFQNEEYNHEIYLTIKEDDNRVLISGCSHKGIEHIVETLEGKQKAAFTHVMGGYHFSHYDPGNEMETAYLGDLASNYAKRNSTFYSCHCTGDLAFAVMKEKLDDKLQRIKTGSEVIIE